MTKQYEKKKTIDKKMIEKQYYKPRNNRFTFTMFFKILN